ncbi:MAG: hypothetical protein KC549_16615 [Myxococcales bacterium]|nr:hypothetical protein [Myxococcales bacterium]MCB9545729.1 hypothetical protein [Myxococcales bacterium]
MPRFQDPSLDTHSGGGFQFSAARLSNLGATEYTLGLVVVDVSGSVGPWRADIERALKAIVTACGRHPRADNLMLRVVLFDSSVQELHGFKPLPDCDPKDYDGVIRPAGATALFDATWQAVRSAAAYGKLLVDHQYQVNAAVFVITDGADNSSKMRPADIKRALAEAQQAEVLESALTVLVGLGTDHGGLDPYLDAFRQEAGFQQYVAIGQTTADALAKLGGFISRSLQSQSQALGSGGASVALSF